MEWQQSVHVLSPECVSCVDSCLNYFDISNSNLDSLKDTFKEIMIRGDDFAAETDFEVLPPLEEVQQRPLIPGESVGDVFSDNKEAERNSDSFETKLAMPFLSNYYEDLKRTGNIDIGPDLGVPTETEPSTEDFFRVWNLDIPAEEDELSKYLFKALEESSLQGKHSVLADSGVPESLKEESVDLLIAGISNLSVSQNSGLC
ncbi:hypothetical protein NMG60_11014749 [Bertholletia excelsa]